jgi:hypothetical protein
MGVVSVKGYWRNGVWVDAHTRSVRSALKKAATGDLLELESGTKIKRRAAGTRGGKFEVRGGSKSPVATDDPELAEAEAIRRERRAKTQARRRAARAGLSTKPQDVYAREQQHGADARAKRQRADREAAPAGVRGDREAAPAEATGYEMSERHGPVPKGFRPIHEDTRSQLAAFIDDPVGIRTRNRGGAFKGDFQVVDAKGRKHDVDLDPEGGGLKPYGEQEERPESATWGDETVVMGEGAGAGPPATIPEDLWWEIEAIWAVQSGGQYADLWERLRDGRKLTNAELSTLIRELKSELAPNGLLSPDGGTGRPVGKHRKKAKRLIEQMERKKR